MNNEPTSVRNKVLRSGVDRRSPYDLSGPIFRLADESEREALLDCRWKGYKQYGYSSPRDCWKPNDE
jgi:hypothetical protein